MCVFSTPAELWQGRGGGSFGYFPHPAAPTEHGPPVIHWGPANHTVLPVGATVWLPCWVAGDPQPHVAWLKDGRAMPGPETRTSLLENGTLQISSLRVSRPAGESPEGPGGAEMGSGVQGVVGAQGAGCPGCWLLRTMGQELFPLQVTDSGQYECVATSSMGETRWSGTLQVQGELWGCCGTREAMGLGKQLPWVSAPLLTGDGSGLSPPPPEPAILPQPPSTPLVTNVTKSSVTLSWKGNEQSSGTTVTYVVEAFRYPTAAPSRFSGDLVARCHPAMGHLCPLAVRQQVARGRQWQPTWRARHTL